MNKLLYVGLATLLLTASVVAIKLATANAQEKAELVADDVAGGGTCYVPSKGATCEIICNGQCPIAPSGWELSQNTGRSGVYAYSNMAGRCATAEGIGIIGEERMCCYFQTNSP